MDIPKGWRLDPMGRYTCMCDKFRTADVKYTSSHMSNEFEGFCVRGLKCTDENKYVCICGKEFSEKNGWKSTKQLAIEHVCDQMEKLIKVCINQFRNKCQKCNKQLDSPQALRIHYKSNSHINFETKVDLYCKICNIHYRGQKEMKVHLETSKHKKKSLSELADKTNESHNKHETSSHNK